MCHKYIILSERSKWQKTVNPTLVLPGSVLLRDVGVGGPRMRERRMKDTGDLGQGAHTGASGHEGGPIS